MRIASFRLGATNPTPACAVVMVTRPGLGRASTLSASTTGHEASVRMERMRLPGPGPSVVTTMLQPSRARSVRSAAARVKSPR